MWTIQLLGGLMVQSSQRQVTRFRKQKAASLLAYLAFHPAPQPRETLLAMLWPEEDPEVGRHNLSNALSLLRHLLEPPGVPPGTVILADRLTVRLNPAAVTVDVQTFETAVRLAQQSKIATVQRLTLWQEAVEAYQGVLLPGFYEDWITSAALRLESLFVQVISHLVPLLLEAGRHEEAVSYAQRAVTADLLSEEATHHLMQALAACGQPALALRAYRAYTRRLKEELSSEPSQALQQLAGQLKQSHTSPSSLHRPPVAKVSDRTPARRNKAASQKSASEEEFPAPSLRSRLVGGEFLLRTTTRFFGREEEIESLERMLSTPRTRLVTLTGPGGTGKSRLALEVAAHLVQRTAETVQADVPTKAVFVALAPVTEADRLFEVILRSLCIAPAPNMDPLDQLTSVLEARPNTLLVLDNFEQLVEAGALRVYDLLGKAAGVKVLVTSRQRLHIKGEHEFHLAPLPTSSGTQSLETLHGIAGIALFVDRAQAALPDFQLTERNALAVAQLCDYLEGLPLAIELAAASVALLTPARILEQVQANRLDFLSTRRRDAESRQKTLRATLDWSYALLPEATRAFLAGVSVFRGGWTLAAAQDVCRCSETETLDLLAMLRDSSLIGVTDTNEGMRFTLLETIREYGQERLTASGEDAGVRRRHRDHFLILAEQAESEILGSDQAMWMERLQTEHDNLCAAIEWCETEEANAEMHLRLVGALSHFWDVRGYLSLGRGYLAKALGRAEASAPRAERAKALQGAGWLDRSQGDYESARTLFEQGLAIFRELGDKGRIAMSLDDLGRVASNQGDYGIAKPLHEQSLAMSRELGDRGGIAMSLYSLGNVVYDQGDYEAARALLEESLSLCRALADQRGIAMSLDALGRVASNQGDYDAARTLLQESLAMSRELGHTFLLHVLGALGYVAREVGDYAQATRLYQESLLLRQKMGNRLFIARSVEDFANLAGRQGQHERVVRLLGAAEALCATLGRTPPVGYETDYRFMVEAARAALSEEAFAAIWEDGRTMTRDEAVAYALQSD